MLRLQTAAKRTVAAGDAHPREREAVPMRRDFAEPFNARVLHRGGRVEALGDGAGDQRGALLLKQRDQLFLFLHQRIDPCRLPVEKRRDGPLFICWCKRKPVMPELHCSEVIDRVWVATGNKNTSLLARTSNSRRTAVPHPPNEAEHGGSLFGKSTLRGLL